MCVVKVRKTSMYKNTVHIKRGGIFQGLGIIQGRSLPSGAYVLLVVYLVGENGMYVLFHPPC